LVGVGRVIQENEWRRSANEIKPAFARNSQIDADNIKVTTNWGK
jgi:hypothetical protein